MRSIVCATFALLWVSPAPRARSVDEALTRTLAELTSPFAEVRFRAERRLATDLGPEDYPQLAEAVEGGDAEVRTRIVRALGSDDRHIGLAALLAGELRPELHSAGRTALEEMLLRWSPDLDEEPLVRGELRQRLLDIHDEYRPRLYELDLATPLTLAVDRIARNADVPLALVVDPIVANLDAADAHSSASAGVARGVWDQMLVFLAERAGHGLEGFGLGEDGLGFTRGFVRICRRRDEGRRTGVELVLEWLHDSVHAAVPERRAAAARALGGTGWPAAVDWLGRRYVQQGDAAAREGALVAAARGRVAPVLLAPATVARLLSEAEAELATTASRQRAWLALDALAALPPVGLGGASLVEPILAGWDGLDPRRRWFRLAVLEGMAPRPDAIRALVEPILAKSALTQPGAAQPLRLQALRTLAAARRSAGAGPLRPVAVAAPAELLAVIPAFPEDGPRDAMRLLVHCGVAPPPDLASQELVTTSPAHAAACFEWAFAVGDEALAAACLAAGGWDTLAPDAPGWPDSGAEVFQRRVAGVLRDAFFRAEVSAVESLIARLRQEAGGTAAPSSPNSSQAIDRLAALAGVLEPERHASLMASGAVDPELWGALTAGPERLAVRAALVEQLGLHLGGPRDPALDGSSAGAPEPPDLSRGLALRIGLERAIEELFLVHQDQVAERWLAEFRSLAAESDAPRSLRGHLLRPDWPPAPRTVVERLDASDRRLDPGSFPP